MKDGGYYMNSVNIISVVNDLSVDQRHATLIEIS